MCQARSIAQDAPPLLEELLLAVTIHVAKTTLSRLLARVEAGEEIIIARGRTPVARLVPIQQATPKRRFGAMRGKARVDASFFEPLPEDELKAWE